VSAHKYHDLRQHIEVLRARDMLWEIDDPIDMDSELHPLVRSAWSSSWAERPIGAARRGRDFLQRPARVGDAERYGSCHAGELVVV
jgi:uncharacterized protein (DUF2267 family)